MKIYKWNSSKTQKKEHWFFIHSWHFLEIFILFYKIVFTIIIKNFIFLNDMSDFISAICNEQGVKGKSYPMVLILDNKGKVLHYSVGAYQNLKEAAEFSEMINKLE